MPHTTSEVQVHDHTVTVQRGGQGPDLLFLHAEANTSAWGAVHDALAEHFTVTAPVHPGFGGDPLPAWLHDVSDLAFHYVDTIVALGLDRPLVVGASLGGWIGLDLAIHRPDLVSGLVLVGALGLRPTEPMPDLFLKAAPEAFGYLARTIDAAGVDPLTGDVDLVTAVWVEQATQARLMWERPYDRRLERRAHFAAVVPTTVVWGADDRLLPVEHGRRLAEMLGAELDVVPDAGHLVTLDNPAAVAAAARSLTARTDAAAPAASASDKGETNR
ncbi:MAG: alpha/beta hydrolase [Acidimicrobiia bacterium]|nr:alpha/beta hydrolase [Acidimicrobiia bacterium]MDH5288873.1 alpha/beta hydrolase [Acidimicrobiia bacterium]